jgi:anti-sigma regulatory factor (Ser/Thr protein kinase)
MSSSDQPSVADRAAASFAAEPRSVPAARQYTTDQLTAWGVTGQSVVAGLMIVSELASNAVRHAHSRFELELTHTADTLRIAVSDESVAPPVLQDPRPDFDSGFGLQIIATLASEWGFELGDAGKEVWVRLASVQLAQPPP